MKEKRRPRLNSLSSSEESSLSSLRMNDKEWLYNSSESDNSFALRRASRKKPSRPVLKGGSTKGNAAKKKTSTISSPPAAAVRIAPVESSSPGLAGGNATPKSFTAEDFSNEQKVVIKNGGVGHFFRHNGESNF